MPPLSWNEIKNRALAFSREWAERGNAEGARSWRKIFRPVVVQSHVARDHHL
jgi:hypothetical protein